MPEKADIEGTSEGVDDTAWTVTLSLSLPLAFFPPGITASLYKGEPGLPAGVTAEFAESDEDLLQLMNT